MPAAASKAAQARADYRRELERINRNLSRIAKEGKTVPASMLPRVVKRPTQASVERLRKITGRDITKAAVKLEDFEGVAASRYTLPPTEKQLERERKRRRKRKRKPSPPESPELPEEPEGEDDITFADILRAQITAAINEISVPVFRERLREMLAALSDEELVKLWDSAGTEIIDKIHALQLYIDGLHNKGVQDRDIIQYAFSAFSAIVELLTGRPPSAELSLAVNDAIIEVEEYEE